DVKQKLESKIHARVVDGLLLDFRKKPTPHLLIVEYELSSHDLERHVIPQLRGFVKALDNEDTITTLRGAIYTQVNADSNKRRRFKRLIGDKAEVHFALDRALHSPPTILLVYDSVPEGIYEVLDESDFNYDTFIMEFRTFE